MVLDEKLQRVTVYQLQPKCGWPVGLNPVFKLVEFSLFLIFNCDSHLLPPSYVHYENCSQFAGKVWEPQHSISFRYQAALMTQLHFSGSY